MLILHFVEIVGRLKLNLLSYVIVLRRDFEGERLDLYLLSGDLSGVLSDALSAMIMLVIDDQMWEV